MTAGSDRIGKGESFSFSLDTALSELDRLHANVEKFGFSHDLEKRTIFEIKLVLEEIFTNIITYGHADKNIHQVNFSLLCNKDGLMIRIEDDGVSFNLLEAEPVDPASDLENRSAGGLGIHLIRQLMDKVTYNRIDSKNVVTLRKNFSQDEVVKWRS